MVCLWTNFNSKQKILSYSSKLPSDAYFLEVKELFANEVIKNKIGLSLNHSSDYQDLDTKSTLVNRNGYYLRHMGNGIGIILISDYDVPITKKNRFALSVPAFVPDMETLLIKSGSFYRFVN